MIFCKIVGIEEETHSHLPTLIGVIGLGRRRYLIPPLSPIMREETLYFESCLNKVFAQESPKRSETDDPDLGIRFLFFLLTPTVFVIKRQRCIQLSDAKNMTYLSLLYHCLTLWTIRNARRLAFLIEHVASFLLRAAIRRGDLNDSRCSATGRETIVLCMISLTRIQRAPLITLIPK